MKIIEQDFVLGELAVLPMLMLFSIFLSLHHCLPMSFFCMIVFMYLNQQVE